MSSKIPDPEYIAEHVHGAIYALPGGTVLVIGTPPPQLTKHDPLLFGDLVLRFGLTLQIPPGEVMIPGLFAAEKGGILIGREAWDFLQRQFQMHPRADVVGLGLLGQPIQKYVREVDFGVPVRVYAYAGADQVSPTAELSGLLNADEVSTSPELATRYLPRVTDLDVLLKSSV
jgi:hypothetical protein